MSGTLARSVMVLGTTSGAGKSWLTTALCRYYARQGLKVAPFKAQNMSNNARVVAGGEIGSAQYFQALAARAEPDVRMNPLLLKPEKDTQSQVILMGQVDAELSRMPWRGRSASVWPVIARALDELLAENDVVVIEGAGSPAEINLKSSDIVNMRVAQHTGASCLLVTDIDRGGAFAHLYGTWAMLDEAERQLIKGFVLNKFRGDASLLAPGPQMLQEMTGVPTVATLPMWWQHGLPEEDGVFDMAPTLGTGVSTLPPEGAELARGGPSLRSPRPVIAVIAYPRISNLDEFQPLKNVPGVHLKWVRSPGELAGVDWIILPGSKHTSGDLAWLRAQGLDRAVAAHAEQGGAVLGVCGGLQMLGEALIDPHGIDGNAPGLGLLPVVTVFEEGKTVQRRQARFGELAGAWAALSGVGLQGYEIHHGQTAPHTAMAAAGDIAHGVMAEGLAWQNTRGNVLGLYLHGMFEDPAVLQALFGATVPTLDAVFDGLADYIEQHFEPGVLQSLIATP
ncbi:adenosylcobyric acid synthase (glutamine-hydrolysing) [Polaromonas sp. JS666]|uniref:Cobyric acid synthase n=2 Tax=Polaromonas sp. (strain JS666 / ATCC BAA-500) TaxID=296591 RepID=COBQ_POLSJ|nr:cobyric acid synthase [Polaromonas sp. JS666]Q129W6.1 RecName: Full=Cobyric acid synthase [Polaromonas sp. JS666]ABE44676.1 adenosylcobyric acid synthase (glutamine-hydrolysing) [Polaromonas sp. JS666]